MGPSNAIQFPGASQYAPPPETTKPVPSILPDKSVDIPPPVAIIPAPMPMPPIEHPVTTTPEVPKAAIILGTVHTYAQKVPWFVWLGVGATAAYFYNRKR